MFALYLKSSIPNLVFYIIFHIYHSLQSNTFLSSSVTIFQSFKASNGLTPSFLAASYSAVLPYRAAISRARRSCFLRLQYSFRKLIIVSRIKNAMLLTATKLVYFSEKQRHMEGKNVGDFWDKQPSPEGAIDFKCVVRCCKAPAYKRKPFRNHKSFGTVGQ